MTEDSIAELNDTTITSITENDVLTYRSGAWINSTEVDLAEANVTVANISTAYITTDATIATAKVSDLTSGRVVLAGTSGLTFDGTVLTSTEITTPEANITVANVSTAYITTSATIATAKVSDLTSGRVVIAGTSGEIEDSTNLTFDGTVLTSTEITTPEANVTVANVSTAYITSSATIATAKISDLTSGRVVIAGTSGEIEDSGNLTFDGTVLTSPQLAFAEANVTVANVATLYVPTIATIFKADIEEANTSWIWNYDNHDR